MSAGDARTDPPELVDVYETVLYGSDVGALVAFYAEVVGLHTLEADDLMAALRLRGGGVLLIFDPVAAAAPGRFVPSHGAVGAGHIAFRVQDLDAWRHHLVRHAVGIEREIDWGAGRCSIYVRDPAGNSVEFVSGELWQDGPGP